MPSRQKLVQHGGTASHNIAILFCFLFGDRHVLACPLFQPPPIRAAAGVPETCTTTV